MIFFLKGPAQSIRSDTYATRSVFNNGHRKQKALVVSQYYSRSVTFSSVQKWKLSVFFFSFFVKLPLPQLGLAKLLEHWFQIARRWKRKKYWWRIASSGADSWTHLFPRNRILAVLSFFSVFSCCCSEKETEQSLGFPSRHMSAHRHPAMMVGNFKFPDFWKMKSRNNSIFLLFYSRN